MPEADAVTHFKTTHLATEESRTLDLQSPRIAIISTTLDSSPKVLAASLKFMMQREGVDVVEIDDRSFLNRLFPLFGRNKKPGALHFRMRRKFACYFSDRAILKRLRETEAIIFCVASPNAFWRHEFAIETLRRKTGKPIVLHEVYYLGNAPSQIKRLTKDGDHGIERYDWHLSVTPVTEIRSKEEPPWSAIGLNLEGTSLAIPPRKEMRAIVDFPAPGYEKQRAEIILALENTNFPYVELTERLPMAEIRKIYMESSLLFLSFPEAFGVPIAECLSCGTAIFTPKPMWAMSWRLREDIAEESDGLLAKECFWIYGSRSKLEKMLIEFKSLPEDCSNKVRSAFLSSYPSFYYGNRRGVREFLLRLEKRDFG